MKRFMIMLLLSALFAYANAQNYHVSYGYKSEYEGKYYGNLPDGRRWYVVRDYDKPSGRQEGVMVDVNFSGGTDKIISGSILIPLEHLLMKGFTWNNQLYFEGYLDNSHPQYNDDRHYITFDSNGKVVFQSPSSISYWLLKDDTPKMYKQVYDNNGCCGLIDRNLSFVIPFSAGYTDISGYVDTALKDKQYISVQKDGLWGLYDLDSHKEIVPPSFDEKCYYDSESNKVEYYFNGYVGVRTLQGQDIIPTTRGYTTIKYNKALKRYTYEMYGYKGECDSYGKELSRIKVATPQGNHTSSTSSNSNSSTTTSSSSSSSSTPARQPVQVWHPCTDCGGTGLCRYCQGNGKKWYGNSYQNCVICHGGMSCTSCNGRKGYYSTEYR